MAGPRKDQRSAFNVRVGEREHAVEVHVGADGSRTVTVDGEPFEVSGAGAGTVRVSPGEAGGGRQLEVTLAQGEDGRPTEAWLAGGGRSRVTVQTQAEARLAAALGKSAGGAGSGTLTAPMPGRIVKVLITPGESVERGAPVIIMEAMKMENELQAPVSGVVQSVAVAEGDTVDAGAALCEIEAPEGDENA
ncbi:Biotin/lipoyl attachment protein [Plesiocystis pacifica SIR-1]|uniref:Biotin/lipoyl attachment protein n=1 Tax=Plesiocystis pacifica SIR-1 TaxID=391625 RepID=A6GIY7_9BACT|nr:acetyl-CoA carboxylase biotin carboxyl carrier protein subunit [Plesiocystis pacifica]EDM74143.1 Biotin/lipoyl attachment protein [Plesiocystis pacifica SIR-1]